MDLHRKLFFLLLVFLPTQLGFHLWPSWAYVLGHRVDYLSPTLYLTDLIIFFLLATWVFESVYLHHKKIRQLTVGKELFFIFPIAFICLNIYFALNQFAALYAWVKIVEYVALSVYIVRQRISFSAISVPLAIGIFYTSAIGIVQYFLQHSIGGIFWFLGEREFFIDTPGIARISVCQLFSPSCVLRLRAYSTFSHPNVFGGFLAVGIPLLAYEWTQTRKSIYCIVASLGILALAFTFSRSSWLVAVFGLLSIWLWQYKSYGIKLGVLIVLGITLAIGFVHAPIQEESVVVRQQLNIAAVEIWNRAPLLGVGAGNFLIALPSSLVSKQIYFLQPVHNIYLLMLSELGLLGVGICIGMIIWVKNYSGGFDKRLFPLGLCIAAIALLGLVDHYFLTLQQGQLLLVLIISLSIAGAQKHPQH